MATICPYCQSPDTNALADKVFCLSCAGTFVEGEAIEPEPVKKKAKKGAK